MIKLIVDVRDGETIPPKGSYISVKRTSRVRGILTSVPERGVKWRSWRLKRGVVRHTWCQGVGLAFEGDCQQIIK